MEGYVLCPAEVQSYNKYKHRIFDAWVDGAKTQNAIRLQGGRLQPSEVHLTSLSLSAPIGDLDLIELIPGRLQGCSDGYGLV